MRLLAAALATLLLLTAGCGADDDEAAADPDQPPPAAAGDRPAGGLRVEEALGHEGTQLVRGFLVARDGEARLCTVLAESFPPQCGEPSLLVEGLDVGSVVGTTTAESVTWSEREVMLEGEVDGDVLRVSGSR
jgi:hypothetical protein